MKNPVVLRNECIDIIVKKLSEISIPSKVRCLRFWVVDDFYDSLFDYAYTTEDMIDKVKLELENDGYKRLADLTMEISSGLPETSQAVVIKPDEIICEKVIFSHATVCQIPGKGTMHQESYRLEFKEKAIYNIGTYIIPPLDGSYRENYIAINEQETDALQMEINQHVSRTHADIRVVNGCFCLHASLKGCRYGTKIIREGIDFPITSVNQFEPLQDQDIIVLGRQFMMKFCL